MRALAILLLLAGCGTPEAERCTVACDLGGDLGELEGPHVDLSGVVSDLAGDDLAGDDLAGGNADLATIPCTLDCDGHGKCMVADGKMQCHCDAGYASHLTGQDCQPTAGTACDGVSCTANGSCVTQVFGGATCQCDPGYQPYGMACVQERKLFCRGTDGSLQPRGTTRCGSNGTSLDVCRDADGDGLVEWAFGVDCANGKTCATGCLGAPCPDQPCAIGTTCVPEAHGMALNVCVVTCDCTNCGTCDISMFTSSEQAVCGATSGNTPTKACNMPCPSAGDGCIPYSPGICWPLEGCFSGPPI
jgi:hypothetical protein